MQSRAISNGEILYWYFNTEANYKSQVWPWASKSLLHRLWLQLANNRLIRQHIHWEHSWSTLTRGWSSSISTVYVHYPRRADPLANLLNTLMIHAMIHAIYLLIRQYLYWKRSRSHTKCEDFLSDPSMYVEGIRSASSRRIYCRWQRICEARKEKKGRRERCLCVRWSSEIKKAVKEKKNKREAYVKFL